MLDCTWSDLEAEIVLRKLSAPVQPPLQEYYLKLREEYRRRAQAAAPVQSEQPAN